MTISSANLDKIQKFGLGGAVGAIAIHVLAGAWAIILIIGLLAAGGIEAYKHFWLKTA
jgi:hypothetical protein